MDVLNRQDPSPDKMVRRHSVCTMGAPLKCAEVPIFAHREYVCGHSQNIAKTAVCVVALKATIGNVIRANSASPVLCGVCAETFCKTHAVLSRQNSCNTFPWPDLAMPYTDLVSAKTNFTRFAAWVSLGMPPCTRGMCLCTSRDREDTQRNQTHIVYARSAPVSIMYSSAASGTLLLPELRRQENKALSIFAPVHSLIPDVDGVFKLTVFGGKSQTVGLAHFPRRRVTNTFDLYFADGENKPFLFGSGEKTYKAAEITGNSISSDDLKNLDVLGAKDNNIANVAEHVTHLILDMLSGVSTFYTIAGYSDDVLEKHGELISAVAEISESHVEQLRTGGSDVVESEQPVMGKLLTWLAKAPSAIGSVMSAILVKYSVDRIVPGFANGINYGLMDSLSRLNVAAMMLPMMFGAAAISGIGSLIPARGRKRELTEEAWKRYAQVLSATVEESAMGAIVMSYISGVHALVARIGNTYAMRYLLVRQAFTALYGAPDNRQSLYAHSFDLGERLPDHCIIYFSGALRLAILCPDIDILLVNVDSPRDPVGRSRPNRPGARSAFIDDIGGNPRNFIERLAFAEARVRDFRKLCRQLVGSGFRVALIPLTMFVGTCDDVFTPKSGSKVSDWWQHRKDETLIPAFTKNPVDVTKNNIALMPMWAPVVPCSRDWHIVRKNTVRMMRLRMRHGDSAGLTREAGAQSETSFNESLFAPDKNDTELRTAHMIGANSDMKKLVAPYSGESANLLKAGDIQSAFFYNFARDSGLMAGVDVSSGEDSKKSRFITERFTALFSGDSTDANWKDHVAVILENAVGTLTGSSQTSSIYIPSYLARSSFGDAIGAPSLYRMGLAVKSALQNRAGGDDSDTANNIATLVGGANAIPGGLVPTFEWFTKLLADPLKHTVVVELVPPGVSVFAFVPDWLNPVVQRFGLMSFRQLVLTRRKSPLIMEAMQRCVQDLVAWNGGLFDGISDTCCGVSAIIDKIEKGTDCTGIRLYTDREYSSTGRYFLMVSKAEQGTNERISQSVAYPGILGAYSTEPQRMYTYEIPLHAVAHQVPHGSHAACASYSEGNYTMLEPQTTAVQETLPETTLNQVASTNAGVIREQYTADMLVAHAMEMLRSGAMSESVAYSQIIALSIEEDANTLPPMRRGITFPSMSVISSANISLASP